MLLCGIQDVQPGMTVAASVMHPARPETELVAPGLVLDEKLLTRLAGFGVDRVWIDHDITEDLRHHIDLAPSAAHQAVYGRLKDSFRAASKSTISAADMLSYRQAVMDLVCELMGNKALATLADRLSRCDSGEMFRHAANVAYLSVLVALEMETYIIRQRAKLTTEHARDLTALGIGAMLHDIGKLAEPSRNARELSALSAHRVAQRAAQADVATQETLKPVLAAYRNHAAMGYRLLEAANAPASARQVVLTHHQRWDGTGFPAMDQVTSGRQTGTQQGEKIHIFSRIVAAADLLDHLLRDARENQRPAVAALAAFKSRDFEPWLDPIVRDAVLRTIPPFPVASHIKLSDGRAAVVIAPNPVQPCLPTLRLLDADTDEPAQPLALAEHRGLSITHLTGQPVEDHVFLLPEQKPMAKLIARAG